MSRDVKYIYLGLSRVISTTQTPESGDVTCTALTK